MTPALNWERYEYICWQAREAVPPDVEERIQGPFLSAPESGDYLSREWFMRMGRKRGRPAEQLWLEELHLAVDHLKEAGIPVPAILKTIPRAPEGDDGEDDEPDPPRPAKGTKAGKTPKAERPASDMSEHLQQGGFARVANAVVDQLMSAMSGSTFKVLVYCYRIADRAGKFRVGYGTLARVTGSKHRNTGVRVMTRLIESGLVERTRTGAEGYTSHYLLVDLKAVDFEKAKAALARRRVRQGAA